MPTPPAFHDKSKMFHGIGHIELRPIECGPCQRLVQHLTGGADERFAGEIFLIPRLLSDEHDARLGWAASEDGLGRGQMQFAALAGGGRLGKIREGGAPGRGSHVLPCFHHLAHAGAHRLCEGGDEARFR